MRTNVHGLQINLFGIHNIRNTSDFYFHFTLDCGNVRQATSPLVFFYPTKFSMYLITGIDHRTVFLGTLALGSSVAIFSTYKWLSERKKRLAENVYESEKLLNEYLVFHYGSRKEVLRYDFGPVDALDFPKRCADVCLKHTEGLEVILCHK